MDDIIRCTRCIMDNSSDSTIRFDEDGHCDYCNAALKRKDIAYFPNEEGQQKIENMIREIKADSANNKYDCIMGLSGGLDSSYLAYLGYKWGLKVLAVHIDDGYDTEISKANLEKLIKATGFDYKVIKPDEVQFNDLTLAYMKAGVPNIAIPQDNVLFAFLYDCMRKYKIKYFLAGGNFALESILQRGNTYKAMDVVNIKDIHKRFGTQPINKLKFISSTRRMIYHKFLGLKTLMPLDYVDYNRDRAFEELKEFCGFEYYGRKHLENILTAFIQLYWFPKKFGVDKRSSHLSSMIISDQMTREEALEELNQPLYDEKQMAEYISVIEKRLDISDGELKTIMAADNHQHTEYKMEDQTWYYRVINMIHSMK